MIRILALIAGIGFLVSVVCLGGAAALASHAIRNGWQAPANWNIHIRDDDGADIRIGPHGVEESTGPQATRTLAWGGGQRLEIDVPATVRYTQSAGPARLTVTGPRSTVDRLVLTGPRITTSGSGITQRVVIEMTAPNVTAFRLSGSNRLEIEAYRQDRLDVESSGSARISAQGEARQLGLRLSGSGNADMEDLNVREAVVQISGSGEATIAPRDSAEVNISGHGEVNLTTRPRRLNTNISGSGRVNQPDPEDTPQTSEEASPAPPATNTAGASAVNTAP